MTENSSSNNLHEFLDISTSSNNLSQIETIPQIDSNILSYSPTSHNERIDYSTSFSNDECQVKSAKNCNHFINSTISNQDDLNQGFGMSQDPGKEDDAPSNEDYGEEELSQDLECSSEELSDDDMFYERHDDKEIYDEELDTNVTYEYDEGTCEEYMFQSIYSYKDHNLEQDKFHREMNRTKIAFAAYRNAVLHLIQNQNYKHENDIHGTQILLPQQEEKNADERMATLETLAKHMVETKAKATFDAVLVANEFIERRAAKKELSRLLTTSIESKVPYGGQGGILETPVKKNRKETDGNDQTPQYVKLKRLGRHPDCIISNLPKHELQMDSKDDLEQSKDEKDISSKFSTTRWIGRLVTWKRQRKQFQRSWCEQCSCPDCRNDLQRLL